MFKVLKWVINKAITGTGSGFQVGGVNRNKGRAERGKTFRGWEFMENQDLQITFSVITSEWDNLWKKKNN